MFTAALAKWLSQNNDYVRSSVASLLLSLGESVCISVTFTPSTTQRDYLFPFMILRAVVRNSKMYTLSIILY